MESYLDHHGQKLVRRFDANTYVVLNRSMDLHDIGRGRGGTAAALGRIRVPVLTASITSDRLYPPHEQQELHDGIVAGGGDCRLVLLESDEGHDGFLLEHDLLRDPVVRLPGRGVRCLRALAAPSGGLHAQTRAIRAGRADNQNALAPILWATSTFTADTVSEAHDMAVDTHSSRFYSRYGNPTVKAFEETVADLEGTESARAFASGMGALSAIVLGLCSSGDHIVAQRQLYAGTQLLLQTACPRFGIGVTFVDGTEPGAFAEAVIPWPHGAGDRRDARQPQAGGGGSGRGRRHRRDR